jgi:hypothetical protein
MILLIATTLRYALLLLECAYSNQVAPFEYQFGGGL